MTQTQGPGADPAPTQSRSRGAVLGRFTKRLVVLVLIVGGIALVAREARQRLVYVDEIDARISGDLVTVSSRVAGWLTDLEVEQGDRVSIGKILMRIDARESQLLITQILAQVHGAESEYKRLEAQRVLTDMRTRTRLETQGSMARAASATVGALEPQLELANSELRRARSLFDKRVIPKQRLDQARAEARQVDGEYRAAQAGYQEATARLAEVRAEKANLKVLDKELEVLRFRREALNARLSQQKLDLEDRIIRSPLNAIIDKTFVEVGEYVRPGQRLAMLHDPKQVWVEANIKETRIGRLRQGQKVEISVDAYPKEKFFGQVVSIGSSTTASYALLPNPNPSGNFTKITQRLPVRISVEDSRQRLYPGMMVEVRIHVGGN